MTPQRKWVIRCKVGTFLTYSITYTAAQEVATWCNRNHPECKPHIIDEEGTDDGLPLLPL